jgi:hypothetical protein
VNASNLPSVLIDSLCFEVTRFELRVILEIFAESCVSLTSYFALKLADLIRFQECAERQLDFEL